MTEQNDCICDPGDMSLGAEFPDSKCPVHGDCTCPEPGLQYDDVGIDPNCPIHGCTCMVSRSQVTGERKRLRNPNCPVHGKGEDAEQRLATAMKERDEARTACDVAVENGVKALARAEAAEKERDEWQHKAGLNRADYLRAESIIERVRERAEDSKTSWQGEMERAVDGGHISRCKVRIELLNDLLSLLNPKESECEVSLHWRIGQLRGALETMTAIAERAFDGLEWESEDERAALWEELAGPPDKPSPFQRAREIAADSILDSEENK